MPFAAAASGSTPSVTFVGKPLLSLGTLSCPSTPDVSHVTLDGGSVIDFINHTGKAAVLHVAGQQLDVANQASRSVTLHDGTYSAEMDPDCLLDTAPHGQVTVDVKPATFAAAPPPTAAPTAATHQTTTGHIKTVAAAAPAAKPTVTTGSGAKTNATTKPTSAAGWQPQTIGAVPSPVNNRPLIWMILAAVILLGGVIIAQLLSLRRRLHRAGHGGNGGGDRRRGMPKNVTDITDRAAQVSARAFEMGRKIGRREAGGGGV